MDDELLEKWASRIYDSVEFSAYRDLEYGSPLTWEHNDPTLVIMHEFVHAVVRNYEYNRNK